MSLNIFSVSPRFLLFHAANSSSVSYISFLMQQIPTLQAAYHLAKPAVLSQHLQKIGLEEEKVKTRLRHHDENTSAVYHRRSRCLWVCGLHMGNQWSKSCSLEHSTQNRWIHMISCHIHNSVCSLFFELWCDIIAGRGEMEAKSPDCTVQSHKDEAAERTVRIWHKGRRGR